MSSYFYWNRSLRNTATPVAVYLRDDDELTNYEKSHALTKPVKLTEIQEIESLDMLAALFGPPPSVEARK